ncbi:MAG: threonine synthase [Deltaproteobacteria bacterium]|nr:threonine synthase [Deltaproteobacteria bacterium]
MRSFLDHLQCTACGRDFSADQLHTVCPDCGKVLFARYDLSSARKSMPRDFSHRPPTMWRYQELMPVREQANIVSLGEGMTPLLHAARIGRAYGFDRLFIKEEGLNPTGTFKARGMSAAVSRARELGVRSIAAPSAGNAAGALAAYGAAAGVETSVFMPADAPEINKIESAVCGAKVYLVDGLIGDAAQIVRQAGAKRGWFDLSTLKEPYRVEGKKTMGFELAEQLGWQLPDAIIYPTGGGTGMLGMWKAFDELEQLGWLGKERPKMISVQAAGCAPIVRALLEGKAESEAWQGAYTIAAGLRVPHAFADYLILRTIRESDGTAIAISDDEIVESIREVARLEGLFVCPEGAAAVAAFKHLAAQGYLHPEQRVVLFNTGSGLKYAELVKSEFHRLNPSDSLLLTLRQD